MKSKRFSFVTICTCISVILSGCWDEIDIENRAFITAIAIDLADESDGKTMIELTEQIIVPTGLGTSQHPAGGDAYRNLSRTGEGLFEINRNISRQENRKMDVEHLGLILISTELAEKDEMFANVLDVFVRQQYMRRGVLVAIVENKAKDLLNVKAEHAKIPAQYISEVMEQAESIATINPLRIGDIHESLLIDRSFAVPLLASISEESIYYEGIAVMSDTPSKLAGTLLGEFARGRNLIIGEAQDGAISTDVEGELASYEILDSNSKYKLINRNGNKLTFQVDIDITASLREYFGTVDFYNPEILIKFEHALGNEVMNLTAAAVTEVKDKLQIDVLDFDTYLRMHHNTLWEEIKHNWDYGENYFAQSEIIINVNANITEPGTSIRINSKGD